MGKLQNDLEGQRFGLLVAGAYSPGRGEIRGYWECACDCGGSANVSGGNLISGRQKSCGCLLREFYSSGGSGKTHGMSGTPTHKIWKGMLVRCYTKSSTMYWRYGGRGLVMCDRWRDSFLCFLEDMGERPEGKTIDRIDGTKGYSPENCRWATMKEQANNASHNRLITHNGKTTTLTLWAEKMGLGASTIWARLDRGWSAKKALETPLRS